VHPPHIGIGIGKNPTANNDCDTGWTIVKSLPERARYSVALNGNLPGILAFRRAGSARNSFFASNALR
jgi:hypothetical protein